ncbi:MAG: hypothetical protein ACI4WW_02615 [Candidatus Coprovivens sp.]
MTYGTLIKICLAFLEQDIDTNVMEEDIETLKENDVFKEYINNIDGSIYNAISRLVQSKKLDVQSRTITKDDLEDGMFTLPDNTYQVREVNAITSNGLNGNIGYQIIANKLLIFDFNKYEKYIILYYPRIAYFDTLMEKQNVDSIYDVDFAKEGLPDELIIAIKYAVYGDMKTEDNPSLALSRTNYFESVLSANSKEDSFTHQTDVGGDLDCQLD